MRPARSIGWGAAVVTGGAENGGRGVEVAGLGWRERSTLPYRESTCDPRRRVSLHPTSASLPARRLLLRPWMNQRGDRAARQTRSGRHDPAMSRLAAAPGATPVVPPGTRVTPLSGQMGVSRSLKNHSAVRVASLSQLDSRQPRRIRRFADVSRADLHRESPPLPVKALHQHLVRHMGTPRQGPCNTSLHRLGRGENRGPAGDVSPSGLSPKDRALLRVS